MSNLQRFGIEHSIATKNPAPMTLANRADAMAKLDQAVAAGLVSGPRQRWIVGLGQAGDLAIHDEGVSMMTADLMDDETRTDSQDEGGASVDLLPCESSP